MSDFYIPTIITVRLSNPFNQIQRFYSKSYDEEKLITQNFDTLNANNSPDNETIAIYSFEIDPEYMNYLENVVIPWTNKKFGGEKDEFKPDIISDDGAQTVLPQPDPIFPEPEPEYFPEPESEYFPEPEPEYFPEPEPEYFPEPEPEPEPEYVIQPEYVAPQPECLIPVIPSLPGPEPILPIIPETSPIPPLLPGPESILPKFSPEPEPVQELPTVIEPPIVEETPIVVPPYIRDEVPPPYIYRERPLPFNMATNFLAFGANLQLFDLLPNSIENCKFRDFNTRDLSSDYFYQGAPSFTYRATSNDRYFITTPLTPPEYKGDGSYALRDADTVYFRNTYNGTDQFPLNGWQLEIRENYLRYKEVNEKYLSNNCSMTQDAPIFEADNLFRIVTPGYTRTMIDWSKL